MHGSPRQRRLSERFDERSGRRSQILSALGSGAVD